MSELGVPYRSYDWLRTTTEEFLAAYHAPKGLRGPGEEGPITQRVLEGMCTRGENVEEVEVYRLSRAPDVCRNGLLGAPASWPQLCLGVRYAWGPLAVASPKSLVSVPRAEAKLDEAFGPTRTVF